MIEPTGWLLRMAVPAWNLLFVENGVRSEAPAPKSCSAVYAPLAIVLLALLKLPQIIPLVTAATGSSAGVQIAGWELATVTVCVVGSAAWVTETLAAVCATVTD